MGSSLMGSTPRLTRPTLEPPRPPAESRHRDDGLRPRHQSAFGFSAPLLGPIGLERVTRARTSSPHDFVPRQTTGPEYWP